MAKQDESKENSHLDIFIKQHMDITGTDAGQYCKYSGSYWAFEIINNKRIAGIGIVGDKEMNNLKMLKVWNGYLSIRSIRKD